MAAEPETPTLARVVHRAVEVCDPSGTDEGLAQLLERFGDRDEPVTAVPDVETALAEQKGALDPQDEDPGLMMAAAVATYLAHRRDELDADRERILRLAARAEWDGHPPERVVDWLAAQGVEV
jgi:hypothetical protein